MSLTHFFFVFSLIHLVDGIVLGSYLHHPCSLFYDLWIKSYLKSKRFQLFETNCFSQNCKSSDRKEVFRLFWYYYCKKRKKGYGWFVIRRSASAITPGRSPSMLAITVSVLWHISSKIPSPVSKPFLSSWNLTST